MFEEFLGSIVRIARAVIYVTIRERTVYWRVLIGCSLWSFGVGSGRRSEDPESIPKEIHIGDPYWVSVGCPCSRIVGLACRIV